jgi:hypothetical protein
MAQFANGAWASFPANVPRITDQGLLIEQGSTNAIRNNSMVGAVPGTPGTNPTHWAITYNASGAGLTPSIIGVGSEFGLPYIDYNISGAATASSDGPIWYAELSSITAASGQTWTGSWFARVVAGTLPTAISPDIFLLGQSSGGITEETYIQNITITSALTRVSIAKTLSNASTAKISCGIQVYCPQNQTVNFTLRLYAPQLEQASFAGSPIFTSGSAVTRAGDVVAVTGAGITAAISAEAARSVTNLGFGSLSGGGEVWLFTSSPFQNVQFTSTTTIGTVNQAGTSANVVIGNTGSYGGVVKAAAGFDGTSITMIANGGAKASNPVAWGTPGGLLCLGSNNGSNHYLNAYLTRLTFGPAKGQFDDLTASPGPT